MYRDELRRFMIPLVLRGLQIDLTGSITHKHTEGDPAASAPPMKFHLCTEKIRAEGRMHPDDIATIGRLMWLYAKQNGLDDEIKALASVPRVGDEVARAFMDAAEKDGFICPVLQFAKFEQGVHFGRVTNDARYPRGGPLWLIDDLVNRSFSKRRMMASVKAVGYQTAGILVFLDYDLGARKLFEQIGIPLHALIRVRDVLEYGKEDGTLDSFAYDTLINYLEASRERPT